MIRLSFIAILVFVVTLAPAQTTNPLQSGLQQALVGKSLSLRIPLAGKKLAFAANGQPKAKSQRGLRSIDGMIRVRSVQLQNATIAIKAERILMIYNAQAGSLVNGGPELPVDIQLEMPVGSTESISEILKRVFFSGAELDARACSADEKSAFQSMVSRANLRAGKKAGADTDAGQREVHSYCFPTGDKSFTVAKGILPPKPLRTPDPEYEMSARRDGVQGTSLMVLAIGTDGLPVDALLVKGTDPRLNYKAVCALREWTFKPALRDGVPVPVIVFVEINFALR